MKTIEKFLKKQKNKNSYLVFFEQEKLFKMYNQEVIQDAIIHTINFMNTNEKEFFNKELDLKVLNETLLFNVEGKEKEIFENFKVKDFPCILKIKNMELVNFAPNFVKFNVV